jgi:hypothetical protein
LSVERFGGGMMREVDAKMTTPIDDARCQLCSAAQRKADDIYEVQWDAETGQFLCRHCWRISGAVREPEPETGLQSGHINS